jgi:hypothetical protein
MLQNDGFTAIQPWGGKIGIVLIVVCLFLSSQDCTVVHILLEVTFLTIRLPLAATSNRFHDVGFFKMRSVVKWLMEKFRISS